MFSNIVGFIHFLYAMLARLFSLFFWFWLFQTLFVFYFFTPLEFPLSWSGLIPILQIALVGPIAEELVFRYWLYGKRTSLRLGLFVSFLFTLLAASFDLLARERFSLNVSSFFVITGLGVLLGYTVFRKVEPSSLIRFFDRLSRSWAAFIVIVLLFEIYHLRSLDDWSRVFKWSTLLNSFMFTYLAKKYGLRMAMLAHGIVNSLSIQYSIQGYHDAGLIDREYFYFLLPINFGLILCYYWWLNRVEKKQQHYVSNPITNPITEATMETSQ